MSTTIERPNATGNKRSLSSREKNEGTGVFLFSTARQLLFMNESANRCLRDLTDGSSNGAQGVLPPCVIDMCAALLAVVTNSCHPKDLEHCHIERVAGTAGARFLLRGLVVPEEPLQTKSRLIVLVEQMSEPVGYPTTQVGNYYRLTEREQMVVIYLMLGFTNKEIANRIDLSEYTVKEHIKRIMHKTSTTTRTGLVARLIFAPQQARQEPSHATSSV
jgi:DNA-binding CsgD family transcriptional regulator